MGRVASGFPPFAGLRLGVLRTAAVLLLAARALPAQDVAVLDGVMPRVRAVSTATPSGEPWIDSNIWAVRLHRAVMPSRPVSLKYDLENPVPADYLRAIADAAVAGGRWVISPDAASAAKQATAYVAFFDRHREWSAWQPAGSIAVIYDPAGKNVEMSRENLNLIARKQIPYRIIPRAGLAGKSLQGIEAVLASDLAPPTAAERALLEAFAQAGGLVVGGPSWGAGPEDAGRYTVRPAGKGRIAAYKEEVPDPEALPGDLRELLGRQAGGLRLFNAASVLPYVSAAPGRLLVQLVNYATAGTGAITVRLEGGYRAARLYVPEENAPSALRIEAKGSNIEIAIPEFAVYAALLLEE